MHAVDFNTFMYKNWKIHKRNRQYSYSRYWTGTSLQWRLMGGGRTGRESTSGRNACNSPGGGYWALGRGVGGGPSTQARSLAFITNFLV